MRKNNSFIIWSLLSALLGAIFLTAEGFILFKLKKLNLLPVKYFAVLAAAMLILTILLFLFLFLGRKRNFGIGAIVRRSIAGLLAVLLTVGCFTGYHALDQLDKTFDTITGTPAVKAHVGVYVLSDDTAKSIADAAGYSFGITDSHDAQSTQKALLEIRDITGSSLKTEKYNTVFAMIGALYAKEVQAIVLNTSYISILEEAADFSDFLLKTKLLYEYTVMEDPGPTGIPDTRPQEHTKPSESIPPETTVPLSASEKPFVLYVSGSDTRSTYLAQSRSDVNILATVNPVTKQILLVNTPRDYFIPNPAGNGALDKLTHCGIYGIDCSVQALSDLYDQAIPYYAQINFTGFETLIDAIGGITIYSDINDGVYLEEGANNMDGKLALEFARNRYSYADGDHARGRHQMMVITAVVKKMTSGSLFTNYFDILDALQGMFVTSMPNDVVTELIQMQLSDMAQWEIFSYAVGGIGDSQIPYSMPGFYTYVMHPDLKDVAQASVLMGQVLDGEILTEQDLEKN